MVQFGLILFAVSLIAATSATPTKRTVAQVEADLTGISSDIGDLNTRVKGFPASGLTGALGIHTAAETLMTGLTQGKNDITSTGSIDAADATAILNSLQGLQPSIQDTLNRLVAEKASFAALPVSGVPALVLADLQNLKNNSTAFGAALAGSVPSTDKALANAIQTNITNTFTSAISAFQ